MRFRSTLATAFGLAGASAAVLAWVLDARAFYAGWLAAVTLFTAWPLGSTALLLTHALTGGRWGEVLRPAMRLGVCATPLLPAAILPLIAGVPELYGWADPGAVGAQAFYLNLPFLTVRVCVYVILWCAIAWLCLRARHAAAVAPAALFLLAVSVSFATIDSTMSLDPRFTSSVYGMIAGSGMVLTALSLAIVLSAAAVGPEMRADLSRLLLALTILWVYLDFMQLLIIWQSDLAAEAPWYLLRSRGPWGVVRALVAVGHVLLPIGLLLSPAMQRSRGVIVGVCALLLAMEVLRSWWLVLPAFGRFIGWVDVACMAGLAGVAVPVALFVEWRLAPAYRPLHA